MKLPKRNEFWPEDLVSLLGHLAQILDAVKSQDWRECWSEWDQAQRDAITAYMLALRAVDTAS